MFKLKSDASYMMPVHFGPRPFNPRMSGWYRDVTAITVSYTTDRDALAQYIPPPFEVTDEAVVTVYYARNRNVDWLAGHGYNMIGVNASVLYRGDGEELEGTYSLVIWENLTDPILTGRELQGIPKIYADIPDHSVIGNDWRCTASHFGHKIIDIAVTDTAPVPADMIAAGQQANRHKDNPMGLRFMPGPGGLGASISEPTLFPSENKLEEVKAGIGSLTWHRLSWEQNPTQFHIVNALADLPIGEMKPALITKGQTNLFVPDRLPRPLR